MTKSGQTEEQIVAVLRQVEAGARVDDVCRKVGMSQATYYLWKRKYTGVGVSELRELRQLRDEVGRVARPFAFCAKAGEFMLIRVFGSLDKSPGAPAFAPSIVTQSPLHSLRP